MKRFCAFIFSFIIILSALSINVYCAENLSVSAKSAVLYCVNNGNVVFEKNAYDRLPMASTTKIMTALLTLEQNTPDRVVTTHSESKVLLWD